jgi:hypothetical protein
VLFHLALADTAGLIAQYHDRRRAKQRKSTAQTT